MSEELSFEERKARFWARYKAGYYDRKPDPVPVVMVPVSEKMAAAIRCNPGSVRVVACGVDGVSVIDRPQRNPAGVVVRVDLVRAVDADGVPIVERIGVVHEYDPMERGLKR